MCGIAGFVVPAGTPLDSARDAVSRMNDRMAARGPDATGIWASDGVVLGHRRLAVIDLDPRANQPMLSADGRFAIVFNGEIYNFDELRKVIAADGVPFRTTSDTEVLLALFAREGERMLSRLRGMFALAIWDVQARALFLARDPYGIKPLYYARTKDGLLFASQVKALKVAGPIRLDRELAALAGFYLWGSVPEPWTFFRDVFALRAGHSLWVRDGVPGVPACWHDIRAHWRGDAARLPESEVQERVREAVTESVRAHLVSDVPVSVFLSAGIDSAAIAGVAASLNSKIEGITISFDAHHGGPEDEASAAATIASHFRMPHIVRRVSPAEIEADLPKILDAMDQPSIDGVNTWFASKAAAERGCKVVLSGVGGDELFCGYPSFRRIPRAVALGRVVAAIPGGRALLGVTSRMIARGPSRPKFAGIPAFLDSLEGGYFLSRCLFLPDELGTLMGVEEAREGLARLGGSPPGMERAEARDGAATVALLESTHYLRNQLLRDSDWASMSHSLELRTPLVDVRLLEAVAPHTSGFAARAGKRMLARSPKLALPESVSQRAKTGFTVPMNLPARRLAKVVVEHA